MKIPLFGPTNHYILGTHCYTDYVSNWSDIICSIWGLVSAYLAVNPNSSDKIYKLSTGLNSIAPTWSIGVAGAFWVSVFLLSNFRVVSTCKYLVSHDLNSVAYT